MIWWIIGGLGIFLLLIIIVFYLKDQKSKEKLDKKVAQDKVEFEYFFVQDFDDIGIIGRKSVPINETNDSMVYKIIDYPDGVKIGDIIKAFEAPRGYSPVIRRGNVPPFMRNVWVFKSMAPKDIDETLKKEGRKFLKVKHSESTWY